MMTKELLQGIFLDMEPPRTTHQQKKIAVYGGKPHTYEGKALKMARQTYMHELIPHQPEKPYSGALAVEIIFGMTASRKKDIGAPKTTRPDLDNMSKLLLDCMTRSGLIVDDSIICDLHLVKRWSESGYVDIRIYEYTKEGE